MTAESSIAVLQKHLIDPLPAADRELLRVGAAPRFLNRDLALQLTGSEASADRLISHPLVRREPGPPDRPLWSLPIEVRQALLDGYDDVDQLWQRVAEAGSTAANLDPLYALLAAPSTRTDGLAELRRRFHEALDRADVPAAHDLLALLDEWPLSESREAQTERAGLEFRLHRYGRANRDRQLTSRYFERAFERELRDRLLGAPDPPGDEEGHGADRREPWLLEMHAPGGRGKTMFLKNLLGRYCPEHGIPVARIDFDYVAEQALVTREPWRLLLAIARQLDPQLPGRPFDYLLRTNGSLAARLFNEALPRQSGWRASTDGTVVEEGASAAADEVPRRFGRELATAVKDGLVVVAIDTVENVLHAGDADLMPLLSLLRALHDGGLAGDQVARVPGLRVIVTGRYDLTGQRRLPDGESSPRCRGFVDAWMGPNPRSELLHGGDGPPASLTVGRDALSFELPPFSRDEARTFLTGIWQLPPGELVEAIVDRCHDNPMKLVLLAEHARQHDLTADIVRRFPSVDLVYLVDRVVDRIPSGPVQWLLRWGSLFRTVSRDVVDEVIWPALVKFARSEAEDRSSMTGDAPQAADYDDTSLDDLPASRHELDRWVIPTPAEVERQGADDEAWADLLDYAADASWVSLAGGENDAVVFHNEIREPMRRLLRQHNRPVYTDIHQLALQFWQRSLESGPGARRSTALGEVVYHAYQPVDGNTSSSADRLWRSQLDRTVNRSERRLLASAVLDLGGTLNDEDVAGPDRHLDQYADHGADAAASMLVPSAETAARAHLELAEALIDEAAGRNSSARQALLADHAAAIEVLADEEPRRVLFVQAAARLADRDTGGAWSLVSRALQAPAPDPGGAEHLALMVAWSAWQTPTREGIEAARELVAAVADQPLVAQAGEALARGLVEIESWTEALAVATMADHADLMAQALLGLGQARRIRTGLACDPVFQAEAALQHFEPSAALQLLPPEGKGVTADETRALLVRGRALGMLDEVGAASDVLGTASASFEQTKISAQAELTLGKMQIKAGNVSGGSSLVIRRQVSDDPEIRIRSLLGDVRATKDFLSERAADSLDDAFEEADRLEWVPPSLAVALQVSRLVLTGPTREVLENLIEALEPVDGPAARLLTLDDLDEVEAPSGATQPDLVRRFRELVELGPDDEETVALDLARAELERVLGDADEARRQIDRVLQLDHGEPVVVDAAVDEAEARVDRLDHLVFDRAGDQSTESDVEDVAPVDTPIDTGASPGSLLIRISTDRSGGSVSYSTTVGPDVASVTIASGSTQLGPAERGIYQLLDNPEWMAGELARALGLGETLPAFAEPASGWLPRILVGDEQAAQWPWEIAMLLAENLGDGLPPGLIRCRQPDTTRAEPIAGSTTYVETVGPIDQSFVPDSYEPSILVRESSVPLALLSPEAGVVHLLCSPIQRGTVPGLRMFDDEVMTADRLARHLTSQRRLVILDLVLDQAATAAAEQLMMANAFAWHLHNVAPQLSVLVGVFDDADGRVGRRRLLARAAAGELAFTDLLVELQPDGRVDAVRDIVSLNSDSPGDWVGFDPGTRPSPSWR